MTKAWRYKTGLYTFLLGHRTTVRYEIPIYALSPWIKDNGNVIIIIWAVILN